MNLKIKNRFVVLFFIICEMETVTRSATVITNLKSTNDISRMRSDHPHNNSYEKSIKSVLETRHMLPDQERSRGYYGSPMHYNTGYTPSINLDTALTTLAFLSFGVFFLNFLFNFLSLGITGRDNDIEDAKHVTRIRRYLVPISINDAIMLSDINTQYVKNEKVVQKHSFQCAFINLCNLQVSAQLTREMNNLVSSSLKM